MPKRPEPSFTIVFKGQGIYPEEIPYQKVGDAIRAAHALIRADDDDSEDEPLRLIGMRRGSAAFLCLAHQPESAIERLRAAGQALRGHRVSEAMISILRPIADLSKVARSLGCTIFIREQDDPNKVLATFDKDTYKDLVGELITKGRSTVEGRVERVGGATDRRCVLRLENRQALLYCDVGSDAVARDLGAHLYETVVVNGVASWLKLNFHITGFRIDEFVPAVKGTLREAFAALREAGGDAWDSIENPTRYLEEIRGS